MDYIALIAQLAGTAAGQAASGMDKASAMALIKSVMDQYGQINVPQLQKLLLEKQKGTALAGIKEDPAYRAEQSAADSQLNDVVNSGGLTLSDRAALNTLQQKLARNASSANAGVEAGMAARGTLDSGSQLAAELANNQTASEQAAAAGENTAAQAQARAYAAINQRAANAGAGLTRKWGEEAQVASAQDAINKGNTDIANAANKYNAGIPQQNFNNQMEKAKGMAGPAYALAGADAANAKDTQQMWQGVGNTVGAAAKNGNKSSTNTGPGADYSGSDKNTPSAEGEGGFGSSPSDWNSYPGSSSDALNSSSTRPAAGTDNPPPGYVLEGYTQDGKPRYVRDPNQQGQNF